jgi:DNA-directed RNA polymerase specialized sigma24 family protein
MVLNGCGPTCATARWAGYDARRTVAVAVATPESARWGAEHDRMVAASGACPGQRRRCPRYYLDLPEAEIAAAMGVSAGSVKTHLHRGLAALAHQLGEEDR